jgi:hypothetical protein
LLNRGGVVEEKLDFILDGFPQVFGGIGDGGIAPLWSCLGYDFFL